MKRNRIFQRWRSRLCFSAFCVLSAGCETVVPTPQVTDQDWKLKFATMMAAIESAKTSGVAPVEPIEIGAANQITLLEPPKRLVVILDTSLSMRRMGDMAFNPIVTEVFAHLTRCGPELKQVWVLDAQGRDILGAKGRPVSIAGDGQQTLVGILQPELVLACRIRPLPLPRY